MELGEAHSSGVRETSRRRDMKAKWAFHRGRVETGLPGGGSSGKGEGRRS